MESQESLVPAEAATEPAVAAPSQPRPGLMRRLYGWVLSWAYTPYGTPALAVVSFAESSFFPIPPDVLQIVLSLSRPGRAFYYAAVSTVASVLGGIAGWWIGGALWHATSDFFFGIPGFTPERFDAVGASFDRHAFLAILGAAFTPIPYKVFTIASGAFAVDLWTLIFASILGRGGRFFLVALGLHLLGPRVVPLLKRHFAWITLALFALVVAIVAATRLL